MNLRIPTLEKHSKGRRIAIGPGTDLGISRRSATPSRGTRSHERVFAVASRIVTSDGNPYSRFQRALKTQNLAIIRTAAAELPSVPLRDALTVCVVIRERQPDAFERAALRWLARFIAERPAVGLVAVSEAVDAFDELRRLEPGRRRARLARVVPVSATHPLRRTVGPHDSDRREAYPCAVKVTLSIEYSADADR